MNRYLNSKRGCSSEEMMLGKLALKRKHFRLKQMLMLGLALVLLLSPFSIVSASDGIPNDQEQLVLVEQLHFDSDTGGFVAGGGTTVSLEGGALQVTGSGSGNRIITKNYDIPVDAAEVLYTFDWRPEDVSTAANSSEILWLDQDQKPIFRIVKQGGSDGGIYYGAGSTGTELSMLTEGVSSHSADAWLAVEVYFDFSEEYVFVRIRDKEMNGLLVDSEAISLSSVDYTNIISSIQLKGNRASGQNLEFTMFMDDLTLMASAEPAPDQQPRAVAEIVTEYESEQAVPLNQSFEDIQSILPSTVDIRLVTGALRSGIPLLWTSDDYNASVAGQYLFRGELDLSTISNVVNPDNIAAIVEIIVEAGASIPERPGYVTAGYTDFGDSGVLVPALWGFTTANATLRLDTDNLAGNATSKLHYNITDQSGGRVASKNFTDAYMGEEVILAFDWYPGKVNDKGTNPNENGGELRITNGNNQTLFTLNHTNNAPLSYYVGNGTDRGITSVTEPEAWYRAEIIMDYLSNNIRFSLTNTELDIAEAHTVSMDSLTIDTKVGGIRLGGVRTSGNNLTWDTYLDEFAVYVSPLGSNTITFVDQLPYHRIYVGDTSDDIASIGLPDEVQVTLADGSKAEVTVASWNEVDEWSAERSGVYEFVGTLDGGDNYVNPFEKTALIYVYNRLEPPKLARNTEWLDRGVIALSSEDGIFVSWRLLADEYNDGMTFHVYKNGTRLTSVPLSVTNYLDAGGSAGDVYTIESIRNGRGKKDGTTTALAKNYLSIPLQKPEGGVTETGSYTYSANDASVGDLDGDGQYEVIVKWYPSNAIDSSQSGMTGPTIFDAYKLDGTLLWRMNMGFNLTSGAHYHQFIVADLDGDGRSEFLIKTADATTVYGTTAGLYDESKVISVIGNAEDDGRWVNSSGKVVGGPEYITVFEGLTGEVIDTIDYEFALGDVTSWGDSFHNRSDRFLAGLAYLDGQKPSVVYGRGYYERTTYAAYSLVDGKLVTEWTFDSAEEGHGGGLGYHSLATGDLDNDGFDEIIAGSLVLNEDGSILYMMDGSMGREKGSHGDAMHVGAFDPDREGLHFIGVHEDPAVASLEYHDGATGETIMSFYGSVDAGRGLAANITSQPGYEFWGTAPDDVTKGGGIYNVQNQVIADSHRDAGLSVNFALYWDGDLLHELLDQTSITKYNETTKKAELLQAFDGVTSNNGTKATPTLQADIFGDWREEVILPTTDSSELRIYSTTIPTEYRLYTLMHDTVYRMGVAWQNTAYNQPPHLGYYLGEDIRGSVLAGELVAPTVKYTNAPSVTPSPTPSPSNGSPVIASPIQKEGIDLQVEGTLDSSSGKVKATITEQQWKELMQNRAADSKGPVVIEIAVDGNAADYAYDITLPISLLQANESAADIRIQTSIGYITLPSNAIAKNALTAQDQLVLHIGTSHSGSELSAEVLITVNDELVDWNKTNGLLELALPYKLNTSQNAEFLTVWRVDTEGKRSLITRSTYDEQVGMILFESDQLGTFIVDYSYKTFQDISELGWAKHEVEVLAARGIILGMTDNQFQPHATITRADFVVLLSRMLGLSSEQASSFNDVAPEAYYYDAVSAAQALGIVQGNGDEFQPSATISRQDMMVIAARALSSVGLLQGAGSKQALEAFTDHDQLAAYAQNSVAALVEAGLIQGSAGKLQPLGTLTRAEAAVLLYRMYQLLG